MKKGYLVLFVILLLIFSPMAFAKTLNIGTGGPTGNYYDMGNDICSYCADQLIDVSLVAENSDGSLDNLIGMKDKKFKAGIVQEDVLQYMAKRSPRDYNQQRIKIIAGLHEESAHLLIPNDFQPVGQKKSFWQKAKAKIGKGEVPKPISLNLLKNQTVGSWGGSLVSTKALSFFMDLNINVVEVPANKRNNPGMPVLLVGGTPYAPVETILATGKYTLVSIDYDQLKAKAPFYVKRDVNYKIGGKMVNVPTFGVRAYLIGKSFRKKERNEAMRLLGKCIADNLGDLADDGDTNPNWETVFELEEEDGAQTAWAYFELE